MIVSMAGRGSIEGEVVGEESVASDLGFADVHEFRRWQTELGHKVAELEYGLRQAIDERDRFRRHGMRMRFVLEKVYAALRNPGMPMEPELIRAIGVLGGDQVDWGDTLKDWFPPMPRSSAWRKPESPPPTETFPGARP